MKEILKVCDGVEIYRTSVKVKWKKYADCDILNNSWASITDNGIKF